MFISQGSDITRIPDFNRDQHWQRYPNISQTSQKIPYSIPYHLFGVNGIATAFGLALAPMLFYNLSSILRKQACALHILEMKYDAVKLELYKNLYASAAEEMGVVLCRTAFSPNIKERRDLPLQR